MKHIKINLFTINTIMHFLTWTDKLRSIMYDVQQEEEGHENLDNFANGYG